MKLEIFDISYQGFGVAKNNGKIVFVPKTLPQERVEAEILKSTSKFDIAFAKQIEKKSKNRIDALCPYFDVCGGCDFQHCNQEYEKELKIEILKKEFAKFCPQKEIEFVKSDKRFFYRNKITFAVCKNQLGFFQSKSQNFLPIESCAIAKEKINFAAKVSQKFLQENQFENLKNVCIKEVGENVGICFLFDKKCKKLQKNDKKLQIFGDFSVFFAFGDILESDKTKIFCVWGKEKFQQKIDDKIFEFDISSFNQVNDFVAEKLYGHICNLAQGKNVVNAYSGQGLLSYLLSKTAKKVFGIEVQKSAHDVAKKLDCQKIESFCGKVEDVLPNILKKQKIDMVVLDPSREGCQRQVLESLKDVESVLYVSCNFSTLVRDLKILLKDFSIEYVKIFDMFPCTANIETVVKLKRGKGD